MVQTAGSDLPHFPAFDLSPAIPGLAGSLTTIHAVSSGKRMFIVLSPDKSPSIRYAAVLHINECIFIAGAELQEKDNVPDGEQAGQGFSPASFTR